MSTSLRPRPRLSNFAGPMAAITHEPDSPVRRKGSRMKRNRIGRAALATMMSMAIGLGVTACSRDYTVAYVYATSAQTGGVSAFAVDFQSGSLVQIAGSPFASGLHNPVSLVVSPDSNVVVSTGNTTTKGQFVYVVGGNQD